MTRRTKVEMRLLRDAIYVLAEENRPCTVRQLYYLGIGQWWDKDQGKSRRTYGMVVRLVGELREAGVLPWEWIADNTRWFRHRTMFNSPGHILRSVAETYRRDLWARQPVHVEVWCESDSIAGVLDDVTYPEGVALFPCRGQSSKTLVYEATRSYVEIGKPVVVIYVGDWDPSGLGIPFSVEDRMARYSDGETVDLDLRRIAVTAEDVAVGSYTTHSVNTKDPNYRRFADRCRLMHLDPQTAVEVEALPPDLLRQRLRAAIDELADARLWNATLAAERSERELLERMVTGDVSAYRQLVGNGATP
ncbi:MAG: hypothetical protein ACRD03_01860 [Acidimicrobiales bacterium]